MTITNGFTGAPTPEAPSEKKILAELERLVTANPADPLTRGALRSLTETATSPAVKSAVARLVANSQSTPRPAITPVMHDPFALARWPVERRKDLTAAELALIVEAARRSDELTLDDALAVARIAAGSNDDAAVRLAELATRPRHAEITAKIDAQTLAATAATLNAMPAKPPTMPRSERDALAQEVAAELAPLIDAPDDVRAAVSRARVAGHLEFVEAARDEQWTATREAAQAKVKQLTPPPTPPAPLHVVPEPVVPIAERLTPLPARTYVTPNGSVIDQSTFDQLAAIVDALPTGDDAA